MQTAPGLESEQWAWNLLKPAPSACQLPYVWHACAGEDVWHAYHLVREGDSVTATTFRKVIRETGGADGSKESEKVKIKVGVPCSPQLHACSLT